MTNDQIEHDNLVMNHAQEIDNLRAELERVKGIAFDRLEKIGKLQHDVAVLEDKLEDTRSEFGGAPSRALEELEQVKRMAGERFDKIAELRRELATTRRELEDTRAELGRKSLAGWAAECKVANARIDAEFDARERELELGREPRSHLELGL